MQPACHTYFAGDLKQNTAEAFRPQNDCSDNGADAKKHVNEPNAITIRKLDEAPATSQAA